MAVSLLVPCNHGRVVKAIDLKKCLLPCWTGQYCLLLHVLHIGDLTGHTSSSRAPLDQLTNRLTEPAKRLSSCRALTVTLTTAYRFVVACVSYCRCVSLCVGHMSELLFVSCIFRGAAYVVSYEASEALTKHLQSAGRAGECMSPKPRLAGPAGSQA